MEAGGGCREQNGCVKTGKRKRLGWRQVCRDVYDEPKNRAGRQDDAPAPRKVFFVTVSKNEGGKQPRAEEEKREFRGVRYG